VPESNTTSLTAPEGFDERHYTIAEVAALWNLSDEFVRQLIRNEPGVTEWVRSAPGKRRYRVLRIPESVVHRIYRRAQERGGFDFRELLRRGTGR
jgi:hypothetical protein